MALIFLFAYLMGSIPFGLILSKKFAKIDIRDHGSKNIGSTNVLRIAGKKLAAITLLLDFIKGIIPIILADKLGLEEVRFAVGFTSVIGHIFPIWIGFKGGKGVATGAGVLLYLIPIIGILALVIWGIIFYYTKTSSISSISAVASINITSILIYGFSNFDNVLFCFMLSLVIIYKHQDNIKRILNGSENPIDGGK